ncbi:phenylalanine--tRNA ligase subunit alpha [candidate division KSB1 bacterium]|nr:phenylalanine--tRNA ligase subunit alpha [candidate division KSB1 bacterium]
MSDNLKTTLQDLESIKETVDSKLNEVKSASEVEELRINYLGRKGEITQYFKQLGKVAPEERPKLGQALNELKSYVQGKIEHAKGAFDGESETEEYVDLTLPGAVQDIGYRNPLLQVLYEIKDIFANMGFNIETGPLVETDYYNFEALNVPADHPSRDLQDTFYLENDLLLRPHTSPVQIRTMEKQKPPVRIIAPGRCFRKDTPDASHSPEFHQVEGLVVDKDISLAQLKGTLLAFARKLFGPGMQIRFRPSFFPFTEPSAEYDFSCVICKGKGCRTCKYSGWLEISGAGMVDPAVFGFVNYDPEEYTGFAWGMGVERIAMMKYQIDDIRHFYENDMRFLTQF